MSASLAAADQAAALQAIATLREKLPFLIDLTPEQRRHLPKMGDKSRAFVERTLQACQANGAVLPPTFDVAEFERDLALWLALAPVVAQVTQLQELLEDTLIAVGSDLYAASLVGYGYLKLSGAGAGLDELRAAMSARFRKAKTPDGALASSQAAG
ncbi:MAG TPA: hypothetical protein VGD81_00105 [Opitutaceae bacterium]